MGTTSASAKTLRMASFAALNSCPPPSQFCGATVARWMGEGRAGRFRERRDARDERDARRGRGGSRARPGAGRRGGFADRRETRGARDDATARRERGTARGGGNGSRAGRGGRGARTWQYVTTNASSEAPAGFPVPAATDEARRAGARIGARRRASAHRAERNVSASEDAVAAAIGVRARGGRVRSRAGNPEWFSSARCTATRPDPRKRTREEIAGRTAKSCECSEKAVFHRWAPLPDSVTKPSRGKKRPGLRLSPGVRTRRSRPVGKSDCRRRGEHAVVVRARRGGHTSAHAALATPRPPQTPPRRRERPAAPSRPHAARASRTGRSHSPRRPRGFRRPTLRASRIRVASAPRSRRARCPRATPRCGSSRRARSARTPPPPRSAASSEGTRRAPTATRPNALARASPADVFAAAGRRFGPTFVPAPQPSFYVTS